MEECSKNLMSKMEADYRSRICPPLLLSSGTALQEKIKHDRLLPPQAAAKILDTSVRKVLWAARMNVLPGFNIGRKIWYFWESDVLAALLKSFRPEKEVYRLAERLAAESGRKVEDLLTQAKALSPSPVIPSFEDYIVVNQSNDRVVVAMSDFNVGSRLGRRFSRLLKKKQARSLDENEQAELLALMVRYEELQLLKAQATYVAEGRGLRKPSPLLPRWSA